MQRVIVIGQAPPRTNPDRPFGRTTLYAWLASAGITETDIAERFAFDALISYFPGSKNGSHLAPTPAQIMAERPALLKRIRAHHPDIILPVGILAIREALQDPTALLEGVVGRSFRKDPFGELGYEADVIPLPHPSGASPWVHVGDHRKLLEAALALVRKASENW